jgi:hypothetical protein
MIFASAYKNSKEYTFQEFQNYFLSNNLRYIKDFGASCGNETIIAKGVNDDAIGSK